MKTAIILHGMPSKEDYFNPEGEAQSNSHWLPWIQHQLLLAGVLAQAIELPKPYEPNYDAWSKVFEQFVVDENTHLIGHSCGAGFLIRWLSEHQVKVGKVILVAPYINPDGDEVPPGFFDVLKIDRGIASRTKGLTIICAKDDDRAMLDSVKRLEAQIEGVKTIWLEHGSHLTFRGMGTREFSELREVLLGG